MITSKPQINQARFALWELLGGLLSDNTAPTHANLNVYVAYY